MCGFAGFVALDGVLGLVPEAAAELAGTMAEQVVHRGPDSAGSFQDTHAAFGFRRLRIIDLATGEQPMTNEDGSVVLMCNGEIFNYRVLRQALVARGHEFASRSDVECLVHLYEEVGSRLLERLNGQFAIALWDRGNRRLMLARDPFGINPLFWTVTDGQLIFGSEIKCLLAHPRVGRSVDLVGLDQVLTFPGLVSPRTLFEGIHSLPPGHRLIAENGTVRVERYWDLDYPLAGEEGATADEDALVEELGALLEQAVRYRLQADVEVGLYLSGGLDSSLVGAMISSLTPGVRRHSFSVVFGDQERSEAPYQQLMAETVGTVHHGLDFDSARVAAGLERMIFHCETPVKETYNTCAMALSGAAREAGVTVVLTGQGADELFAGYVGYRYDQSSRRLGTGDPLAALLEEEIRERLWGDRDLAYEIDHLAFLEVKQALYAPAIAADLHRFEATGRPLLDGERIRGRHPLHQRSYLDIKLRLGDHLLADHGDRMALANAVEARHPFLDPEVAAFATRLPPALKLRDLCEKYIVKRLADRWVPAEIVQREKFGWHAPGTPELLRRGDPWIEDQLSAARIRRQGYFDADMVERLKTRYRADGFDLNQPFETDLLAVILTFGIFLDTFDLPAAG